MTSEPTLYGKRTVLEWAGFVLRVVSASFVVVTIHYIGFFSAIANDYFIVMFPSLVNRVAWELVSTLAYTSLIVSVFLLVGGFLKGFLVGIVQLSNVELPEKTDDGYPVDLMRIAGLYGAGLAIKYFPMDASIGTRLLYLLAGLAMMGLFYLVFFSEVGGEGKWNRFVGPLRNRELAIRAVIAPTLVVSFFAGQGLAASLLGSDPVRIFLDSGDMEAVILASSETMMIIKNDEGLVLLPIHEINSVLLSAN
ncbi:MAG: hypothetical protein WA782_17595 [Sulfitobacter sp.]